MNLNDFPLFSPAMIKTYLYVAITLLAAILVDNLIRSLIKVPKHFDNRRARNAAAITKNIITIVVYIIAAYIVFKLLGIDLTPLLASASIIGLILGIGARSTIEDFVNGLFLLSLDSIAIGDYVKIGDTEGSIEIISLRTLTIRDQQGALHIIPNSLVKELVNFSRNKTNLILDLPLKANQDISQAIKAAEHALTSLQKDETFASTLFPNSKVNGIEDFKHPEIMILRVTLITYPVRRWELGRRYRYLVKKEFEKNKIAFA